jgi:hypothetical protein
VGPSLVIVADELAQDDFQRAPAEDQQVVEDGSEFSHGVYFVTEFDSFANGGGSLVGVGVTDGIDELNKTTGGVLSLRVHGLASSGGSFDGVLGVHCVLPGSAHTTEGVTLSVGPFQFVQDTGATLFHVLAD